MLAFTPHCDKEMHYYYSHPNVTHEPSCGVPHELSATIFVTQTIMYNTFTFEATLNIENLHFEGHIIIHTPMRQLTHRHIEVEIRLPKQIVVEFWWEE